MACLGLGTPLAAATSQGHTVLANACHYLWQQQGEDGGWHSTTHALLRSGQALTPFLTLALLESPEALCGRPPQPLAKALQFLRQHLTPDGALGLADPDILEYPNYATSLALRVFLRLGEAQDAPRRQALLQYLLRQQFVEARGMTPADVVYGAWGFGETPLPPGRSGHVDLSHTRRVLQAVREAGHTEAETYARAQLFLRFVQKHPTDTRLQPGQETPGSAPYDGGFYFAPSVPGANKAGVVAATATTAAAPRSYATATCDGVLALLAAGVAPSDPRLQAARAWLQAHPALDAPQGFPLDQPGEWPKVLFFYHLAARAAVYHALDWPGDWREAMVALLAARQQADGSFVNPLGALNKEDDPLLATALAVEALGAVLRERP